MQVIRQARQGRSKLSTTTAIMLFFLFFALVYIYFYKVREFFEDLKEPTDRCLSELASVKYQLDNVSEYKNKMDALNVELQKVYNIQTSNIQDFVDSYKAMKTQLQICETQTEELEVECKQLKERLHSITEELIICKKPPG